jgi:AcrR family transcriptional regulator
MTASRTRVRLGREERRTEILEEAIRVIGERGFRGFSIRELAQRCAMTDAGLLHHFGTKIDLLLALLDERDRQDADAIAALLGRDLDRAPATRGGVLRILIALARRNAERPELVRLYAMLRIEALAPDHPAHAYFRARDEAARARFAELLAPIAGDARALARRVLAALDGLEAQWLQEGCGFDLPAEWQSMIEGLLPLTATEEQQP